MTTEDLSQELLAALGAEHLLDRVSRITIDLSPGGVATTQITLNLDREWLENLGTQD